MLKNTEQKFRVYMLMFYMLTKLFHEKTPLFGSCVKKQKIGAKKRPFMRHYFCLFTETIKNLGFERNLT